MTKSNISLSYHLNLLEPKYKWLAIAIWNLGCLFWIIGLNALGSIGMIVGNIIVMFTTAYLARYCFRLGTCKSTQSQVLKKSTIDKFNPTFFVNIGGLLSIFVIVFLGLAIFYLYELLANLNLF